jgi:hypothetical protein
MATNSQIDQVLAAVSRIESTLTSGRLFDVLEVVRDQVRDLKNQNTQIRNDIMELQKTMLQQSATPAD